MPVVIVEYSSDSLIKRALSGRCLCIWQLDIKIYKDVKKVLVRLRSGAESRYNVANYNGSSRYAHMLNKKERGSGRAFVLGGLISYIEFLLRDILRT